MADTSAPTLVSVNVVDAGFDSAAGLNFAAVELEFSDSGGSGLWYGRAYLQDSHGTRIGVPTVHSDSNGSVVYIYFGPDLDPSTIIVDFVEADDYAGNSLSLRRSSLDALGFETEYYFGENSEPTGTVEIAGEPQIGQTLSAITETIADLDGLGEFSYQWLRDGSAIDGETSEDYTLMSWDVGFNVSVIVSYTDGVGIEHSLVSDWSEVVVGEQILVGNSGANELVGNLFSDFIVGHAGDDTLSGKGGVDFILGGAGSDRAYGGVGADTLYGNGGGDWLVGNGGNDQILGGGGHDTLLGSGGHDTLSGGTGRDLIQGQKGADELTGGGGRDTFAFNRGDGSDTITDFQLGIDHIQIGRGASRLGQLDFEQVGDDVLVSFRNVEITVENIAVDDLAVSDHFLFV